jgi:hypothetical protein
MPGVLCVVGVTAEAVGLAGVLPGEANAAEDVHSHGHWL